MHQMQSTHINAGRLLAAMLPLNDWLSTASPEQLRCAAAIAGSPQACWQMVHSVLEEVLRHVDA